MVNYKYVDNAEKFFNKLYSEHAATTVFTKPMTQYLNQLIEKLTAAYNLNELSTVLEIGCNNGRLLSMIRERVNCRVIGIEPSKTFKEVWEQENLEVINDYFTEELAKKFNQQKFDLIIFRHVFEHIPDPVNFFKGIAEICDKSTTVIVEVPYFVTVLDRKRIDNIGYSHLNYFTIRSINEIVKQFGMGIKYIELVETDGGAILFHIKKDVKTDERILDRISRQKIEDFVKSIYYTKIKIKKILKDFEKNEVVGYGAGAKGQHLIHLLSLEENISFVVDDTKGYEKMYIPGTKIQIQHSDLLKSEKIKVVINLAPTHSTTIRSKVPPDLQFIEII